MVKLGGLNVVEENSYEFFKDEPSNDIDNKGAPKFSNIREIDSDMKA